MACLDALPAEGCLALNPVAWPPGKTAGRAETRGGSRRSASASPCIAPGAACACGGPRRGGQEVAVEWSHITGREVAAEWSEVMWQTNTHATRLLRRLLFAVPTDTTTAHTRPERTRTQHTAADRSFWRVCGVGVPASPIPLLAWGDAGDRRCSCSRRRCRGSGRAGLLAPAAPAAGQGPEWGT